MAGHLDVFVLSDGPQGGGYSGGQILFEHLEIEKHESAQCLILCGCSDVLVGREITQKGAHLLGAHFFAVRFPMEQDEALDPVHL